MMNDITTYKKIMGYQSEKAALNVAVTELNTIKGLRVEDGKNFVPGHMIKCLQVVLDD